MKISINLFVFIIFEVVMYGLLLKLYPLEWKNKKVIYGVRFRTRYLRDEPKKYIDGLSQGIRRHALYVLVDSFAMGLFLITARNMQYMTILWSMLIFITVILMLLPYIKGNTELRSLKKNLKIYERAELKYSDIKTIPSTHAIKFKFLLIPNVICILVLVFSIIYDIGAIKIGKSPYQGTFVVTRVSTMSSYVSLLLIVIGMVMDNIKDETISIKAEVNEKYNYIKKREWGKALGFVSSINLIALLCSAASILSWTKTIIDYLMFAIFYVSIVIRIVICIVRMEELKEKYKSEYGYIIPEDDDEYWVLGMFYHNKDDKKFKVKLRSGFGSTVNLAHPFGKFVGIFSLVLIVIVIGLLAWKGLLI